jgi:hypothetical protein
MISGDGFRSRPFVAAGFRPRSVSSTRASFFLGFRISIPLRLCSGASAKAVLHSALSRCTMRASPQRTYRPPLRLRSMYPSVVPSTPAMRCGMRTRLAPSRAGGSRRVPGNTQNKKARILAEPGLDMCVRVEVRCLRASLARMQPILVTQRRDRSLALAEMQCARPTKARTHERTPTLQGQRAVGEVALGFHDELSVGCGLLRFGFVALRHSASARRWTVKTLHFVVKRVRQYFLQLAFSTPHPCPTTSPSIDDRTS